MLKKYNRVIIPNGCFEQTLHIRRVGGHNNLKAGGVNKPALQALRMLRSSRNAATVGRPEYHGNFCLTAEHIADFSHLVDYFIHGRCYEIGKMHINDWPHARKCRPDSAADNTCFRNGSIDDSILKKRRQTLELIKNTAMGDQVFSDDKDGLIALHLFS